MRSTTPAEQHITSVLKLGASFGNAAQPKTAAKQGLRQPRTRESLSMRPNSLGRDCQVPVVIVSIIPAIIVVVNSKELGSCRGNFGSH